MGNYFKVVAFKLTQVKVEDIYYKMYIASNIIAYPQYFIFSLTE